LSLARQNHNIRRAINPLKCGRIRILGNDKNKAELHSQENLSADEIQRRLAPFSS
jgi:hypothetical protein